MKESTVWELAGPAAGSWYALVLSEEHQGAGSVPEVLVAPVCASLSKADATTNDVYCPANQSPTGAHLVIAAWAVAPMPVHCLRREIGVLDPAIVKRVRETNARLVVDAGLVRVLSHRPRRDEPAWHRELRHSLKGYWDGSVMISCATLPDEEHRKAS
jgi:hypothetical protein